MIDGEFGLKVQKDKNNFKPREVVVKNFQKQSQFHWRGCKIVQRNGMILTSI